MRIIVLSFLILVGCSDWGHEHDAKYYSALAMMQNNAIADIYFVEDSVWQRYKLKVWDDTTVIFIGDIDTFYLFTDDFINFRCPDSGFGKFDFKSRQLFIPSTNPDEATRYDDWHY